MLGSVTTCNHQKTCLSNTAQVYPNTCGQKIPKEHLPCPLLQMPWDHLRSETKLGTSTKEIKGNKIKQRKHVFDKQQHKLWRSLEWFHHWIPPIFDIYCTRSGKVVRNRHLSLEKYKKCQSHATYITCICICICISYIIYHISYIIYIYIIYHIPYIIYHISYIIYHVSYIIYHISYYLCIHTYLLQIQLRSRDHQGQTGDPFEEAWQQPTFFMVKATLEWFYSDLMGYYGGLMGFDRGFH
jgi:hypothetical protein